MDEAEVDRPTSTGVAPGSFRAAAMAGGQDREPVRVLKYREEGDGRRDRRRRGEGIGFGRVHVDE